MNTSPKVGIILMNLGTPDAPTTKAVRRYLREFLSDPKVLDMSPLGRFLLLNLIILPFRPKKSAAAYQEIWTEAGSPLLTNTEALATKLAAKMERPIRVAMRYGNPSVGAAIDAYVAEGVDELLVVPLFPHYAASSFGSALEHVMHEAGKRWNVPNVRFISPFYDAPEFIGPLVETIRPELERASPDKLLMSFHGLPEHHCTKSDTSRDERGEAGHCLKSATCCDAVVKANRHCYRAQCFATARALAQGLGLGQDQFEVVFQSRLTKVPWLKPFTDVRIEELAKAGAKSLLVTCPSFVADCLETLEEIAMRAEEDFVAAGGTHLRLIPCLNDAESWVAGLAKLIEARLS